MKKCVNWKNAKLSIIKIYKKREKKYNYYKKNIRIYKIINIKIIHLKLFGNTLL